jgi:hypothetical protein
VSKNIWREDAFHVGIVHRLHARPPSRTVNAQPEPGSNYFISVAMDQSKPSFHKTTLLQSSCTITLQMNKISTMKLLSVLVTGLVVGATSASQKQVLNAFGELSYGVDVSFPVHHLKFDQDHQPLGDRRKAYEEFMEGCRQYYPDAPDSCDLTEEDRCAMSVRQPASMQVRVEG